jgi:hypothetical protein
VKELNPASRHAACDAWQTRNLMENAARPWQANCQPGCRETQRRK